MKGDNEGVLLDAGGEVVGLLKSCELCENAVMSSGEISW